MDSAYNSFRIAADTDLWNGRMKEVELSIKLNSEKENYTACSAMQDSLEYYKANEMSMTSDNYVLAFRRVLNGCPLTLMETNVEGKLVRDAINTAFIKADLSRSLAKVSLMQLFKMMEENNLSPEEFINKLKEMKKDIL